MKNNLRRKIKFIAFSFFCIIISQRLVAQQTYWWNNDVFYEVFVRSFFDHNGDGKGDLQGLIDKLNYLNDGNPNTHNDLGVDALWLMPIMPSPSYHGYDITNYLDINPDYGTLQTCHALIDSAHKRGMKIIIDYVMNHTSNLHPWFESSQSSTASPYRNWYVWNKTRPPYGQWFYDNSYYYYAVFCNCMPDLNYRSDSLQNEMLNIAGFWLDSMHVDGFRLDAIQYLVEDGAQETGTPETHQYLKKFRAYYDSVKPNTFTVGEVTQPVSEIATYVSDSELNTCFEFNLASAIISSVNAANPSSVKTTMSQVVSDYPYLQYSTFLTNHDQNRVFDQLGQNMDKMRLAAGIYLTLPGVPFLYYGEEIAMTGSGEDQLKRTPMQWTNGTNAGFTTGTPWENINSNYATYNVQSFQADTNSLWWWYEKLIAARHALPALRTGNYLAVDASTANIYGFMRNTSDQYVLVVHNFTNETQAQNFHLSESAMPTGTYAVKDYFHPDQPVSSVTVNTYGGFSGFEPGYDIAPYQTQIYVLSSATGISAIKSAADEISVFPNPSSDKIYFNNESNKKIMKVEMENELGESINFSNYNKNSLDISGLSEGIYLLKFYFEDGTVGVKKEVISSKQ